MMKYYLAIDLGASSGRHIVGYKKDDEIILEEVYRFSSYLNQDGDSLSWDIDVLFKNILKGIRLAFEKYHNIESLAIDSWGVDYVLLNEDKAITPIYCYRDNRTLDDVNKVHQIISFGELYRLTGIQFSNINTIYQLFDDKQKGRLDKATSILFLPCYLSYLLTGKKFNEATIASTSGMLSINELSFDKTILKKLGYPQSLFAPLVKPSFSLGNLKEEIKDIVKGDLEVMYCASHDTGSSFEAIDSLDGDIILSSGTWSLMGIKSITPFVDDKTKQYNFTNEGGPSYFRVLKNIAGMWIINNISKETNIPVIDLVEGAKSSTYNEIFDVNHHSLVAPSSMIEAIKNLLNQSQKNSPKDIYDIVKSFLLSLATCYKVVIDEIKDITKKKYKRLLIVGGGAKNEYLNSIIASFIDLEIKAIPIEASALGNIKVQIERNKYERN